MNATAGNDNDAERNSFTVAITCACGRKGSVTWEENRQITPRGPQRKLLAVSEGFHIEEGRSQSGDPLVVCDECDTIQDD